MLDAARSIAKSAAAGSHPNSRNKTIVRPAKLCIGTDASGNELSTTPTAYPPAMQQGKLPSSGMQTVTTSASLDTATVSNGLQACAVMDHPVGKNW